MAETLAHRLRRYRKEIKEKDPKLYRKMMADRGLTDKKVSAAINKVEAIEQQRQEEEE